MHRLRLSQLLLGFDAGRPHERLVLLELLADKFVELGRRHGHRLDAEIRQLFLHDRIVQCLGNLLIKPLNDGGWSFGGREHTEPEIILGVREPGLDGGWHVGQFR